VLSEAGDQTTAIVTHGTVLALFLARHNRDRKGFDLWRQLGLPSFVIVTLPEFMIEQVTERVE
jgi:broad specificity phosphatase PhoE